MYAVALNHRCPGQWDETVKAQTRENIERYLVYETGLGKQAVLEVFDHLVGCPKHPGRRGLRESSALRFAEGLDYVVLELGNWSNIRTHSSP